MLRSLHSSEELLILPISPLELEVASSHAIGDRLVIAVSGTRAVTSAFLFVLWS